MFNSMTGAMPLGMYQKLAAELPSGKSLAEILSLAQQQFQEDQQLFEESQGKAGTVKYAYTDPYFEASSLEEEEGEGEPLIFMSALGRKIPMPRRPSQDDQTTGPDPDFQAWLASKYGQQS